LHMLCPPNALITAAILHGSGHYGLEMGQIANGNASLQ